MKILEVEIKNNNGLHARPAAAFVNLTSRFKSNIKVSKGNETVDGKSILGLMLLAAEKGSRLKIVADGSDEDKVLCALKNLVEVEKFGEK